MDTEAENGFKEFAIQLRRVDVGEIAYSCNTYANPGVTPFSEYSLETGRSDFDPESRTIQVSVAFEAKVDPERASLNYSLRAKINGEFSVVGTSFPEAKVQRWAELNGATVLLPFLRELIHSVTVKSGFKPFVLPLMEIKLYGVRPPGVRSGPPVDVSEPSKQ